MAIPLILPTRQEKFRKFRNLSRLDRLPQPAGCGNAARQPAAGFVVRQFAVAKPGRPGMVGRMDEPSLSFEGFKGPCRILAT
jgi:hypothetical protein